jgi:hypothetical protein
VAAAGANGAATLADGEAAGPPSMAIGWISSTVMSCCRRHDHLGALGQRVTTPVTSVVRK